MIAAGPDVARVGEINSAYLTIMDLAPTFLEVAGAEYPRDGSAAGKMLEVNTYAGEPHCFAFYGQPPQAPRPAVALQAFRDADAFFRQHLAPQPTPIAAGSVEQVPIE